jgi:hypothetical protein
MSHRMIGAAFAVGLIGVSPVATAVELNSKAIAIRQADEFKWRDPTGAAPVNQVVLFGDPTKPGFYMVMNRFKPGTFSRPHFIPTTASSPSSRAPGTSAPETSGTRTPPFR